MIFYYTATGNCLYVAKKIEESPKSIPQEMKKEKLKYKDEKIGIVARSYLCRRTTSNCKKIY